MATTALLLGSTGLVGGCLLRRLLAAPGIDRVIAPTRRPLEVGHPKLQNQVIDLQGPLDGPELQADDVYCALGTTIKTAGSKEAFRAVDYDLPLRFARGQRERAGKRFFLVSSMGASATSSIFYSRTKGEVERDLAAEGFKAVIVARPSILAGHRAESRPMERAALWLAPAYDNLLWGPLRKYRSIQADAVAAALLALAGDVLSGTRIVLSDELQALAQR